jgi:hypothetical protein
MPGVFGNPGRMLEHRPYESDKFRLRNLRIGNPGGYDAEKLS